jgi:glycerophosphoryl diester phosphodiesterase
MSKERVRRAQKNKITAIVIMLILCIVAMIYVVKLAGRNNATQVSNEPDVTADDTADAAAEDETAAEEDAAAGDTTAADAAAPHEKAASYIYSHRGSADDNEFTVAAYDKMIAAGSKYISADMVVSADGTIYIASDDYAKDMVGLDGYFSGMSDSQIDGLSTRGGNPILKLSDIFDKYGDSVTYIVDIRYTSSRNINAFTDIVKKYGFENNVIASSYYPQALRPLESTFPDMTKIFMCSDQGTFNVGLRYDYADVLCVPKEIMTGDNLKAARDSGKKFSVWTLNTEEEILSAIELGADSYFTDETELAVGLEEQYRGE